MNRQLAALVSISLAACGASVAHADVAVIQDSHCVAASARKVHTSIINYDSYKVLPGAAYSRSVVGYSFPMLHMRESKAAFAAGFDPAAVETVKATSAFVAVDLVPGTLPDSSPYRPRFGLHCTSEMPLESGFTHHCEMLKDRIPCQPDDFHHYGVCGVDGLKERIHYGLNDFVSDLTVSENSPVCSSDASTLLSYTITIDGNSSDVDQIEAAVVDSLHLPVPNAIAVPLVRHFFDQKAFFHDYYVHFYNGWISTL